MDRPSDPPSDEPRETLPEALHRAEEELDPDELSEAIHHGHEVGGRAAMRQGLRWVLWLALGGAVAASVIVDWRFAFLAALLALFYTLPYLIATAGDSGEEAERDAIEESIREHDRRTGGDPP